MNIESIKTIARQLFEECWDAGNVDILHEIMAENHIFHLANIDIEGRAAYIEFYSAFDQAFSSNLSIKNVIAEGSYAAIHYTDTGTFKGVFHFGEQVIQPTNKPYQTFGIEMIRVNEEGHIAESWPGHDSLTQYLQTGIVRI